MRSSIDETLEENDPWIAVSVIHAGSTMQPGHVEIRALSPDWDSGTIDRLLFSVHNLVSTQGARKEMPRRDVLLLDQLMFMHGGEKASQLWLPLVGKE